MDGPRQILVVVEGEIATTHLLMQVLEAAAKFGIAAELVVSSQWHDRGIAPNTVPLFVRCADPTMLPYARAMAEQGRPYLYYLDDDFWALDPATPLGAYYANPHVLESLDYFVSNAALVLTNTSVLADKLRDRTTRVVQVPTFFKFDLLDGVTPEQTDEIRIGFAGSVGRHVDLDLVKDAIAPALASDPRVVFEFAGTMPVGVQPDKRIRFFPPMRHYDDFIRFQASRNWSIGLAPLLATTANKSKTDNKFREYAACSIAGIYSNFGPYRAVVRDGVDGLLAADGDWTHAIQSLIDQPQKLYAMRQAAHASAVARYAIGRAAGEWAKCLHEAVDSFGPLPYLDLARIRQQIAIRSALGLWVRLQTAFRQGGLSLVGTKAAGWIARKARTRHDLS